MEFHQDMLKKSTEFAYGNCTLVNIFFQKADEKAPAPVLVINANKDISELRREDYHVIEETIMELVKKKTNRNAENEEPE